MSVEMLLGSFRQNERLLFCFMKELRATGNGFESSRCWHEFPRIILTRILRVPQSYARVHLPR